MSNPENRLVVSLGGGSVPGLAGNTALAKLLEELDLLDDISEVWGTSAGSIIAGFWASGVEASGILDIVDDLKNIRAVDFARWEVLVQGLWRLMLLKELPEGLIRGKVFRRTLRENLRAERIEDCRLPLRIIACTDDGYARKVVFREGPVEEACMASMCLPGISFPVRAWDGSDVGYFDGGVVEKTPLISIVDEHVRQQQGGELIVLATHFRAPEERPIGFLQRFVSTMDAMEDQVWEYQLLKARQAAPDGKFVILNPHLEHGGVFDFEYVLFNYLWARREFKEQLSNAGLALRFESR